MKLVIATDTVNASTNDKQFKSKDNRTLIKSGSDVFVENSDGKKVKMNVRRIIGNGKILLLTEDKNIHVSYTLNDTISLMYNLLSNKF